MKKLFIIFVLMFSLTTVCLAQDVQEKAQSPINKEEQDKQEAKALINTMYNSSVSIFSTGKTGVGFCTGVVIKNETNGAYVLTAKHCVGAYEEVYVDSKKVFYTIVSQDDDLALLITIKKIPNKLPVKLAENNVKWGDIVVDFGFPNLSPYIQVGVIRVRTFDSQYIQMKVIPGCSGGGIFNMNGELVGDVWGSIGNVLSVMEPISDVKRFLRTVGVL